MGATVVASAIVAQLIFDNDSSKTVKSNDIKIQPSKDMLVCMLSMSVLANVIAALSLFINSNSAIMDILQFAGCLFIAPIMHASVYFGALGIAENAKKIQDKLVYSFLAILFAIVGTLPYMLWFHRAENESMFFIFKLSAVVLMAIPLISILLILIKVWIIRRK